MGPVAPVWNVDWKGLNCTQENLEKVRLTAPILAVAVAVVVVVVEVVVIVVDNVLYDDDTETEEKLVVVVVVVVGVWRVMVREGGK